MFLQATAFAVPNEIGKMILVASHAGRHVIHPSLGRGEKRAPLKTPAWEAMILADINVVIVDTTTTPALYIVGQ